MPIAYLDEQQRYLFINKAFAEFFERPRSKILGLTVRELLGDEIYAVRKPLVRRRLCWRTAMVRGRLRAPDARAAGDPGRIYPAGFARTEKCARSSPWCSTSPSRGWPSGRFAKARTRFRRIANQAPVLMWVTKLDRTRDFVNDAYMAFVGGSREDAQTLDWRTRIHPDDVDRIVAESIAGEATRQAFTLEGALPARRRRISLAQEHVLAAVRAGRGAGRASSARRRTSPSPRRRSSTSSARSMSGPPSWPGARRSSGRCSKRPWKSWCCWSRTGP